MRTRHDPDPLTVELFHIESGDLRPRKVLIEALSNYLIEMGKKLKPTENADDEMRLGITPSQFMRQLRPEYYSDTRDRSSYVLDGPTLSFQLDTITDRNQTQDFELFCRKLCERVICPNLRPQTGPEGGGDSKVDSETYPVSDQISQTYIGDLKAARER